jgi:hypothetical protein
VGQAGSGITFAQPLALFRQEAGPDGVRRFRDVTARAGSGFAGRLVGRGLAAGDFDGDGDPDLLVTENNGPARLLQNEGGNRNGWVAFRLIGTKSPRDGNGARIRLTAGGHSQTGWVRSGSSYCSASEGLCRFGLGDAQAAETVAIRWSSGRVQRLENVPAGRVVTIRESTSPPGPLPGAGRGRRQRKGSR